MSFLTSLAIIFLSALLLGGLCKKVKLPSLLGMLIVGIVLSSLNLIAPSVLQISSDLRRLALIIILMCAGLSLNLNDLRKNGRCAILMCFLPATFEIAGFILFGSLMLKLDILNAAILGCVMAAVSPAVVIPRMLKLDEQGYGKDKGIPQIITTGASADDVYVIVLFSALTTMAAGGEFSFNIVWQLPVSITFGVFVGIAVGLLLSWFFKRLHVRDSIKVLILLSMAFLFVALEDLIGAWVPYAGLLSIISMGATLFAKRKTVAQRLSAKFSKLWIAGEILLFILVGATVDVKYALEFALPILAVLGLAMIFRMAGVYTCMLGSNLNKKERLFCMIAYTPKATVQAAIGAIPLSLGLASGQLILAAAIIAIIVTAPLGAFAMDLTYKKLLTKVLSDGL